MNNREQMYANPYSKVLLRNFNRKPVRSIEPKRSVETATYIISTVASYYRLTANDLLSERRNSLIVTARQIAMFLIKSRLDYKLKQIGRIFNKDHSTIIYGINTVYDRRYSDKNYRATLEHISQML